LVKTTIVYSNKPFVSIRNTNTEKLIRLVPEAAEAMAVISDYEANSFTFSGYDGIHIVVDVMQRAGTVSDKVKINEVIPSSQFSGLIGNYSFNKKGQNNLSGNRAYIKDGKAVYQSVDSPLPQ
jgi:ABC-type branched-subunit amino acid transport system substrate-binding protein